MKTIKETTMKAKTQNPKHDFFDQLMSPLQPKTKQRNYKTKAADRPLSHPLVYMNSSMLL